MDNQLRGGDGIFKKSIGKWSFYLNIITADQSEYEVEFTSKEEVNITPLQGKGDSWYSPISEILDDTIRRREDYPFDKNEAEINKIIIKIWQNRSLI